MKLCQCQCGYGMCASSDGREFVPDMIAIVLERDRLKAEVERLQKDLRTLSRGCIARKVHKDWPALEGRIMRGLKEGQE